MILITIDFETRYDKKYSLSKMPTEEYIRDTRFEAIGVGVKVGEDKSEWCSGKHAEIKTFLLRYDWANAIAIAHNAMFDAAILSWVFDIRPAKWVDTLSLARAVDGLEVGNSLKAAALRYGLGVKGTEVVEALGKCRADFTPEALRLYGEYCKNDCDLTYALFNVYLSCPLTAEELEVISLTVKMFSEPALELDMELLEYHLLGVRERKELLLEACGSTREVLLSNPKFALLLESLGVEPPTKISKTTGKETFAFAKSDEGLRELREHPDERVQTVVAARLGIKSTLEETRTERFIAIAKRGFLPVPLKYYAAHTGRWGGCLVGDTEVTVYDSEKGRLVKKITDVLLDDLVWDGAAFVAHEGVQFSGFQEVISWDGIIGTEDHVVFTDAGEISLREAMQGRHRITVACSPTANDVGTARELACFDKR